MSFLFGLVVLAAGFIPLILVEEILELCLHETVIKIFLCCLT